MKQIIILLVAAVINAGCSSQTLPEPQTTPAATSQVVVFTEVTVSAVTPTVSPTSTITSTPSKVPTPTVDSRLIPYYWREWPVVPELSNNARKILRDASHPELDRHSFSKIGDCQMTAGTFLGGYANSKYKIPEGYEAAVTWFSISMESESVTAANGLGVNSVFSPLYGRAAGHMQCKKNETPLDCELRTRRPVIVLIAMGTNWKPAGEISFEKHLRVVVDRVLETGALPVLSTKADNIEQDWKLNQTIAQVAYDYDLPLVNVWRSVQDLPNHGLEVPENIYLTGDGWMRRNYAWLRTLDLVYKVLNE